VIDDVLDWAGRGARRLAVALVFVVVASGLWYWQERDVRERLVWMGLPERQATDWLALHRVLRNQGVLLGWSDLRASPLWVGYQLHPVAEGVHIGERPDFRRDWRTLWPVAPDDYLRSGYDRGHLAPNYAIAANYGRSAQRDTFLMSNITPQRPNLNRRLWQRLEEVVIDDFAPRFGTLQVITGPVFAPGWGALLNRVGYVQVPTMFYKIIVVPGPQPRALAFLMPQRVQGSEPLDRYLVTIDRIEALTGLDFFPQLPGPVEHALESRVSTQGWALARVADQPPRY